MPLVVFDLDGTLIDSSRDLADATNAMLAELGGPQLSIEAVVAMVGEGASVLVKRALTAAGLDPATPGALDRFLVQYQKRLTAFTRPYPGIPEALDALRAGGMALAVLTNKPQRPSEEILRELDLASRLPDVTGGDTPAGRKPDPRGLLQIIERAGCTPDETVMVGDSPIDLETARNASTRICLARFGFGYRATDDLFRGDELFVDSAAELPAVLSAALSARTTRGAPAATASPETDRDRPRTAREAPPASTRRHS